MKKAWKWAAVGIGIPALCVAGLWIDSYYRAVAAIRAEDERLARDIAAARSRRTGPEDPAFPFEESHSRLDSPNARRLVATVLRWGTEGFVDQTLLDLAAIRSRLSEGGYWVEYSRSHAEMRCLIRLGKILEHPQFEEPNLQRVSESLARLEATRPTLQQIVTGEHLLDRAEVLRVLHRKEDPYGMILRPPGWREFFSWRILIAKTLRELDDHHREIQEIVARGAGRPESWGSLDLEDPDVRSRTQLRTDLWGVVGRERQLTEKWKLTRSALEALK